MHDRTGEPTDRRDFLGTVALSAVALTAAACAPAAGAVERAKQMHTKVLALHGWNDPMARPEAVNAFAREMHDHGADWQVHAFGGCGHAFTNPAAQDAKGGMHFNTLADARSFALMRDFFAEVFGDAWNTRVTACPWPGCP